jgi:hypothetical protein
MAFVQVRFGFSIQRGNVEYVIPFADAKSKAVKHCPDGLHRIALESFLIAGTPKGIWEPVRTAPR